MLAVKQYVLSIFLDDFALAKTSNIINRGRRVRLKPVAHEGPLTPPYVTFPRQYAIKGTLGTVSRCTGYAVILLQSYMTYRGP